MKFVQLTTKEGRTVVVDTESIALMTPSKEEGAQTAIYETIEDFLVDEEDGHQTMALHTRESFGYIKERSIARYDNEKR